MHVSFTLFLPQMDQVFHHQIWKTATKIVLICSLMHIVSLKESHLEIHIFFPPLLFLCLYSVPPTGKLLTGALSLLHSSVLDLDCKCDSLICITTVLKLAWFSKQQKHGALMLPVASSPNNHLGKYNIFLQQGIYDYPI